MAFTVFQSGSSLYGVDQRGSKVSLTLPTGVTIDSKLTARFAIYGNYAVIVNSPSRPLIVDANLNVRLLTPAAPVGAPVAAASSGSGNLTGAYSAKQTYRVYDADGVLVSESDYGPVSNTVSLTSKNLNLTSLNLSNDIVSASGLYRTTAGTSVYFKWADLDGNTQTTFEDGLSDTSLSTLAAPSLGTPPDLYLIAEYRSRLFGVGKNTKDYLNFSEVGAMYAWPSDNQEPIARLGSDSRGITALIRRRDSLGIGRSNGIYQFTGTDDTNFRVVNITENCGVEATDSVCVYKDVVFFLWKDGVYKWDTEGVKCISDGAIRRWFTSNGTFNLSRLKYAFAHIDPFKFKYRLFLASADSSAENCWIEYDFAQNKWWGPHTSHAFNPTSAFLFSTDSGLLIPVIGGADGFMRRERKRKFDDTETAIDFDVVTNRYDMDAPDQEKYYGQLSVSADAQPDGGTLIVQSTVGDLSQTRRAYNPDHETDATVEHIYDMKQDRHILNRIGVGKAFKLRFRNNEVDKDVKVRGFEINPVNLVGRR